MTGGSEAFTLNTHHFLLYTNIELLVLILFTLHKYRTLWSLFKNCRPRWRVKNIFYLILCYIANNAALKWIGKNLGAVPAGSFIYVPTSFFFSWYVLAKTLWVTRIINLPELFHIKMNYLKVYWILLNSWRTNFIQRS